MRIGASGGAAGLIVGVALGCSVVLGGAAEQCEDDGDCDGAGLVCVDSLCVEGDGDGTAGEDTDGETSVDTGATSMDDASSGESTGIEIPPGPWGCLEVMLPEPPDPMPGVDHVYTGRVIDTITQVPPDDLAVRVCDALDVECMEPVATDIAVGENGEYTFEVPSGFEGYIEFTSPSTVPQLLWLAGPIVDDSADPGVPLQLVSPGIRDTLIMSAGFENDPTRGIVLLVATDCEGNTAAGVSFQLEGTDGMTIPFFLYGLLPELEAGVTDGSGFGGFFNAPPGLDTVSATYEEAGEQISSQRFLIRADWISSVASGPAL